MGRSYAGELLVSRPDMADPNFDGTITFVLEHGDEGAVGVVINRPSQLSITDAFPDWSALVPSPGMVFQGGPVQTNGIIALGRHRNDAPAEGRFDLPLGLVSVDLDQQPALAEASGLQELRVFAGYAGWGTGQLEGEIANHAWWVLPGSADDVFSTSPTQLWATVMRRSGGELRWFANLPGDPSVN